MANRVKISILSNPVASAVLAFNIGNGTVSYSVAITFVASDGSASNQCLIGSTLTDTLTNLFNKLQSSHNPSYVVYSKTHPNIYVDFDPEAELSFVVFNDAGGKFGFSTESTEPTVSNNMIHEIIFTPRQYVVPAMLNRSYLTAENGFLIVTEDNRKIRL